MDKAYKNFQRVFEDLDIPVGIPNPTIYDRHVELAFHGLEGLTRDEQKVILEGRLDLAVTIFKRGGSADGWRAVQCMMAGIQKLANDR